MGRIAFLFAIAASNVHGQPARPWVNLQSAAGQSNVLFQLTTESGWFYTFQHSANLANWSYATDSFGDGTPFSWTNPVSATNAPKFFRVKVNAPNPAMFTNYHSWNNSVSLNNGIVEAIIVPTIGRLQQFRFLGDTNNALWEDSTLYGQSPSTATYKGWGGDKAWPAPQNYWNPTWPPTDFDEMTNSVSFTNGIVTMVSQVDSRFGIRVTRIFELLFNEPVMKVRTIFQRMTTPAPATLLNSSIAVWIDCQANVSPSSKCYVPVASPPIFPNGYILTGDAYFGPSLPPSYSKTNGIISFGPDSVTHKMGFDSGKLVLVGTNISIRIDAPRIPGVPYTAGGSSTEVWVGNYPTAPYFELELLSPAPALAIGQTREFITTYSLFRRTEATTDAEAQKILAWQY